MIRVANHPLYPSHILNPTIITTRLDPYSAISSLVVAPTFQDRCFISISSIDRQFQFQHSIASPHYMHNTAIQYVHRALSRVILIPHSYGPELQSGYITQCLKKPHQLLPVFSFVLFLFHFVPFSVLFHFYPFSIHSNFVSVFTDY